MGIYLRTMARCRAVDVLRSEQARRGREGRSEWEGPSGLRCVPTVEAVVVGRAGAADVHAAVTALPSNERAAILLAFFGGLPYAQVAAELGLPKGTVKSRIRTGLRRLGVALA